MFNICTIQPTFFRVIKPVMDYELIEQLYKTDANKSIEYLFSAELSYYDYYRFPFLIVVLYIRYSHFSVSLYNTKNCSYYCKKLVFSTCRDKNGKLLFRARMLSACNFVHMNSQVLVMAVPINPGTEKLYSNKKY